MSADPPREAELDPRVREIRKAERPILEELRDAGYDIGSLWTINPLGPEALEVVWAHLERGGYPDDVMEVLARLMGRPDGRVYWSRLIDLWRSARSQAEATGLAAALERLARPSDLEQLVALLHDDTLGRERGFLIQPVLRYGGPEGVRVVEGLVDQPKFGQLAAWELKRATGKRQKRYAKSRKELDAALAETARPTLDESAEEWSTSFDIGDWKKFAAHLSKMLGGELDRPLGKALLGVIANAPTDDEDAVVVDTTFGAVRIGWFIDDIDTVDTYIGGPPPVLHVCDQWYATHMESEQHPGS